MTIGNLDPRQGHFLGTFSDGSALMENVLHTLIPSGKSQQSLTPWFKGALI